MPRAVTTLYESYKRDTFVKIYIADEVDPIHVSAKLLFRTLSWFAAAVRDTVRDGIDELRLPDDSLDAWKLLLFWMTYKEIPCLLDDYEHNDCEVYHLIRSWCLGEKFNMWQFQDAVMAELYRYIYDDRPLPFQAIKDGFEGSQQGSVLRKLMGECVVKSLKYDKEIKEAELDFFDGVPGFMSALMAAMTSWQKSGYRMFCVGGRLQEFMVCNTAHRQV